MAKSKTEEKHSEKLFEDAIAELEELELWDMIDPADQVFWEEFFRVEEVLEMSDEFDAPSFSITIQNEQTGEVKTYSNVKLKASRRKIEC
jgi:hypothetical protein